MGKKEELLTGPLVYGLLHVAVTLYFWRSSPVGIIALAVLCVGDGLAEIVGRGGLAISPLPWNNKKVQ